MPSRRSTFILCVGQSRPPIYTEMTKNMPQEKIDYMIQNIIPLKRFGKPEEVGKAVVFLASSDSDFITGEVMDINGGAYTD